MNEQRFHTNEPQIVFEDQDLLAINKPAGMVVNDAESAPGETVQAWVQKQYPSLFSANQPDAGEWQSLVSTDFDDQYGSPEAIFAERKGMVHRLDKETSGILLWAKNPGSQVELLRQFRERVVSKEYLALVHGILAEESGEITAPIARSTFNRQRFEVSVSGRPAVTQFQRGERYYLDFDRFIVAARQRHLFAGRPAAQLKEQLVDYLDYCLVSCLPKTGRTHQIRVHLQQLGHPLVGDKLYQGRKRVKLDEIWCPRHFLHAAQLTLTHPRTRQPLVLVALLPPDLTTVLNWLQSHN